MTNPDKSMAQNWYGGQHRISPVTAAPGQQQPYRPVIKDDPYIAAYAAQTQFINESAPTYKLQVKSQLQEACASTQESAPKVPNDPSATSIAATAGAASSVPDQHLDGRSPKVSSAAQDTPGDGNKTETKSESTPKESKSKRQQVNSLPSYTAMIAQAILNKDVHQCTLGEVYEYMESTFPTLGSRGTGWRNCVRHTLSLNDCFLKLHRPENGRSCNWTIHPSYYENFARGDYRKRRNLRKRARSYSWFDPNMLGGAFPQYPREQEVLSGQQSTAASLLHYPTNIGLWGPQSNYQSNYMPQMNAMPNFMPSLPPNGHYASSCTNPNCFCKANKLNMPFSYMS